MQRDGAEHREEKRVAGHLKTEFDDLLQCDGEEPDDGAPPDPVRRGARLLRKAAAHHADEHDDRDRGRHRQQQTAFGRKLQVVVVGLGVARWPVESLVEDHRDAVGIETGAGDRILAHDLDGVFPDQGPAVDISRVAAGEPAGNRSCADPADSQDEQR